MNALSKYTSLAAKVVRYVRSSGLGPVIATVRRNTRERRAYQEWVRIYGTVTEKDRREMLSRIEDFQEKPLISVVVPVYNVEEPLLRKCLDSVTAQIYPNWELCIADDASTKPHIRPVLETYAAAVGRLKLVFRKKNGHISAASNSALELATGEFTVLLDHDDELSMDALFWVAQELNDHPDAMMIYSDEDLIDEMGARSGPKFKPDFSRDLFYSINLVTHLSAYRTSVLRKIGGFREGLEGSQDYDLALRVIENIREDQIRHIPRMLYHWRATPGSLALDLDAKPYAHASARRAISEHIGRTGKQAEIVETGYLHRVRYKVPASPRVCLILDDPAGPIGEEKIEAVRRMTNYPDLRVMTEGGREVRAARAARLNSAVRESDGAVLCFLCAGLSPLSTDWLSELVSFAMQPDIGVVGAKLLHPDNTIAGSGLVIGAGQIVAAAHEWFLRNAPGNMSRNRLISNYSAISVQCMVVRREVFDEAGGFDEKNFPESLFDADLCMKIRESGRRVMVTPFSELIWRRRKADVHPTESERASFTERWREVVENDPFYNPNLSKADASFSIKL